MDIVFSCQLQLTTSTFFDLCHSSFCSNRFHLLRKNMNKWNPSFPLHRSKRLGRVLRPPNSDYFVCSSYGRTVTTTTDNGTGNISGSTMDKIMERLKKVGYSDPKNERKEMKKEKGSIEDIFYVEEKMLPKSCGGFSGMSSLGVDNVFEHDGKVRFPWEKPKEEAQHKPMKRNSKTLLADLALPVPMLNRLRYLGFSTNSRILIGDRGVTQEVVDAIHEKWKTSEIVRVKYEGAPTLNMKQMHEILERKTGGLVIWRSGTSVILYRGSSYEVPPTEPEPVKPTHRPNGTAGGSYSTTAYITNDVKTPQEHMPSVIDTEEEKSEVEDIYDDEMDNLLDGIGPRYTDWPGRGPSPVDADLLPAIVPGFQPPFRILPYGVRFTLKATEVTDLRLLARNLPPHFAIGRSRQLHGLAEAMIKLWEKSLIVKIGLKRNVHLTTSERMTETIKRLTGGTLLCRCKDFLVFYRGRDFLAKDVADALVEREKSVRIFQDVEEEARLKAFTLLESNIERVDHHECATAGTLGESLDANARWGKRLANNHEQNMTRQVEINKHLRLVRYLEGKLAYAERKLGKAGRDLAKVEEFLKPSVEQADPNSITDEERFMFRKLGRKMKAFLLLGRREVFDGTVENMHLHWKYRELVKVILNAKHFDVVRRIALSLEAESGGVLVSVEKVSKRYAILLYRGRNYKQPPIIRPKNLLTKRKALAKSMEVQRREALGKYILRLQRRVESLKASIEQMGSVEEHGDEQLYRRLESAYSSEGGEESEEEECLKTSDLKDDNEIVDKFEVENSLERNYLA